MSVAIADLVCDRELRERIAAHNRRVVPSFDWADALDRTDSLYQEAGRLVGRSTTLLPETARPVVQPAVEARGRS